MKERLSILPGLLLLAGLLATPVLAQPEAAAGHDPSIFQPLDLPAASVYRTGSGRPGPAYWQQRADFRIAARLDPATHRVTGSETITYTNNSPDTLAYLWLQLDQNLFGAGSRGATLQGRSSRWRGAFDDGGFDLSRIEVVQDGRRTVPDTLVDDTRLRLALATPLPPGGAALDLEIDFAFTVPPYGADRMGRLDVAQGTVYEIAQWYPRPYVYDDVNGWNVLPYLGQGEFFLEYGTFDLALTVPRDFIVAATGVLTNPEEVLTAEQQRRLGRARQSAETVVVVGPEEIGRPGTRPAGDGPLTWRFHAENVRDVAWAASQAFVWDAAAWEDVLLQSVYPAEGIGDGRNAGWEESTQYLRHTIAHYSTQWFRYPYPVATNVAGIVGGMEYPMIVFCDVDARGAGLFGVTDHEFGHTWFPMIVGSDERRHAWMDEGFDTFINFYSNQAFYRNDSLRSERLTAAHISGMMRTNLAVQPIATYPDQINPFGLGFLAYRKPGMGLLLLREYVLGPDRFDPAFRAYIERWAFKHPQPADFFRTIEDVAGEDLDWFWRGWFYSTHQLDQAVAAVALEDGHTVIAVENRKGLVMPVELEVTRTDGQTERVRVPVEAFATSPTFRLTFPGDDVARVTIDPDVLLPDIVRENNTWQRDAQSAVPEDAKGR